MSLSTKEPFYLKIVQNVADQQCIHEYFIKNIETNSKGQGFLSEIFFITIQDTSNGEILEIVVKSAFTNERLRATVPLSMLFKNEMFIYTNIFPKLEKILDEKFVPRCYLTQVDQGREILCFENLKAAGFELFDIRKEMDHEHMKSIFEKYGRFHALGFILKQQEPEQFASWQKNIENPFAKFATYKQFAQAIVKSFKTMHPFFKDKKNVPFLEKLNKYCDIELLKDLVSEENDFSTILHGDCWSNNIMFKYDENRKPKDLRLLDFQLLRFGSPAFDLSYCLYSGASRLIYENYQNYLQIYHNSLASTLNSLGYDIDKIYPFSALRDDWIKYAKFGLMMGSAVLKVKLADKNDVKDLSEFLDSVEENVKVLNINEDLFTQKMEELITHFDDIGAL